jgi:hypothetical protein
MEEIKNWIERNIIRREARRERILSMLSKTGCAECMASLFQLSVIASAVALSYLAFQKLEIQIYRGDSR